MERAGRKEEGKAGSRDGVQKERHKREGRREREEAKTWVCLMFLRNFANERRRKSLFASLLLVAILRMH